MLLLELMLVLAVGFATWLLANFEPMELAQKAKPLTRA